MKTRIAAAIVIAILLLLATHSALAEPAGGPTVDSQATDGAEESIPRPVGAPPAQAAGSPPPRDSRRECVRVTTAVTGETAIDVPSFCVGGLCQIIMWTDATVGAYGSGMRFPVYYAQDPADDSWIGGPDVSIAGASFSDGAGVNGDTTSHAIFDGSQTTDGSYVSLYDDSATETSPEKWSFKFVKNGSQLTAASLYVCPLVYERFDVSSEGTVAVDVPSFCLDGVCGILMWNDATMSAFEPGISWPVHYTQDSTDGSWIGGPALSIASVSFSDGAGVNGDATKDTIFMGGLADGGGYVRLHDDDPGTETTSSQWTIEFVPDAYLTEASYFVYPLVCERHAITVTGETAVDVPRFCTHGVCTVLRWRDAVIGAFGPGFDWPTYYTQDPLNSQWIGGPNLSIAGMSFSDGGGVNGDGIAQAVHDGGTAGDGYARLYDDYGSEFSPLRWTAVFSADGDLTEAAYYICAGSCLRYDAAIPLPVGYFPAVLRDYAFD